MGLKQVSVIAYLLLLIPLFGLIYSDSFIGRGYISVTIQVLAVFLMIWARVTFGKRSFHVAANPTEGGLVTWGPYRFLRHPIYSSAIYFLWAGIFSHLSLLSCILGVLATIALVIRVIAEEHLIVSIYPEYREYAAKTKRFIPFLF